MQFTRTFFASFLAVIAALVIAIPILFMLVGGIVASFSQQEEVAIPSGSILHMKLSSPIVENAGEEPFDFDIPELGPFASSTKKIGLYQILNGIEAAKTDDRIKGIYLNLQGGVGTGWANASSIREALIDFKSSGKFVYAYSEAFGEKAYYLATAADSVYMPPQGSVEFNGIAANRYFLKGMLDKLDVSPRVFKVGTYKSAVEPFIRENMSEENKEQTRSYLSAIWQTFTDDVSQDRALTPTQINTLAETFVFGEAKRAVALGIIDRTIYQTALMEEMKQRQGLETEDKLPLVKFSKYMTVGKTGTKRSENKIAVIFAEGQIVPGKSSNGNMGSTTIVNAIRKATRDERVKGVVLRINSPGGSLLASDLIAQEIRTCREKKPVFASMADLAASGGYYIAAPCDSIYARPNTITGSIGIFALTYGTADMFKENLGVTFDAVETHTHANFLDPNYPMSEKESEVLQSIIERGYGQFVDVVKTGRSFPDSAAVDKIGQGRVWSGKDAQGIGLVDHMGDLNDVVAAVARRVGVEGDYQVMGLPKPKTTFEELLGDLGTMAIDQSMTNSAFSEQWKFIQEVKQMSLAPGIYTMLPYKEYIK